MFHHSIIIKSIVDQIISITISQTYTLKNLKSAFDKIIFLLGKLCKVLVISHHLSQKNSGNLSGGGHHSL